MRPGPYVRALACLFAAGALVAGCGSGDSTETTSVSAENRPAPPKSEFPEPAGRSFLEMTEEAGAGPSELMIAPAATVFYEGDNRFPFGVFRKDRAPIDDAQVAIYITPVPKVNLKAEKANAKGADTRAKIKAKNEPTTGPFPAAVETLETEPAFRAQTTSDDPDAATAVYSSQVDFPKDGEWRVTALIREGDELTAKPLGTVNVGRFERVPRPGDPAPRIHTPTVEDVGGDVEKLTTRIPPDTQNRVDYADALGKEPIILLFATPQFCQSRVCGPVVDVAEQVKEEYGDEAAFIHMEIFKDNDPENGPNEQVRAFHLPTEPWLFAIDENGTVGDVIEGAFGVRALTEAVEKVTK